MIAGAASDAGGAAPEPPDWLPSTPLPIETLPAGTGLWRVHRKTHGALFFGPGEGVPPTYRFDSASGRFGVLYAAPKLEGAVVETLLRAPSQLTVDFSEIRRRAASLLVSARELRVVAAVGANLSKLGTTAALSTGPYRVCGLWSDALFLHPEAPDGLLYASRHDPDERCIALFARADLDLNVVSTRDLEDLLPEVMRIIDRHGKSLTGVR